jgi:hypothetical protein
MNIFSYLFILSFLQKNMKELNLKYKLYPRWIYRKNNSVIDCVKDTDCPFPSACCNHPFLPVQYCCNGWNKRKLEYAYIYNTITQ